ncbi:hypothetical protein LX36DRAFT_714368 [Colletotrichum falcatum]|nr:hypothetical protein LX36DRAFT_714368 [Colletotrichum falcatum]
MASHLLLGSADPKVIISLDDFKLLADVYSHLAEYAATKDKSQIDAAVKIIDMSNPAPWVSSVNLQNFMQKKWVVGAEAQKALDEFRAVYPYLDPEELEQLTSGVLTMASTRIKRTPDAFDISWNVLRWFLPNLATNHKSVDYGGTSTDFKEGVDAAIGKAYKDAVAKVGAAASGLVLSSSPWHEIPNADVDLITEYRMRENTNKSNKRFIRETGT